MRKGLTPQQEECIPKVTFQLIPIKNLVSNQEYQRPLSESHILKTVKEFDVRQINPVKVSRRNGVNYVFDGQHTIEIVAARSGSWETPVWCMIYDELDYAEEAHIFAEQQKNKKNLVPFEVFNAHVEAGEEKYLLIKELVNSYDLEISGDKTKPTNIVAASAIENVYDEYGYHILDQTIRMILSTWEGESGSFSGTMIKAIAKTIVTYGNELQEGVFKKNVGKYTVRTIVRRGKDIKPGILGIATALIDAYNDKKKKNILAPDRLYKNSKYKLKKENTAEDEPDSQEYSYAEQYEETEPDEERDAEEYSDPDIPSSYSPGMNNFGTVTASSENRVIEYDE